MNFPGSLRALALVVVAVTVASFGCGGSSHGGSSFGDAGGGGGSDARSTDGAPMALPTADAGQALVITPANPTLSVTSLASLPSVTFAAKILTSSGGSKTVTPTWLLGDYSVATIDSGGKLTPGGTVAGTITLTAIYGGLSATTSVTVTVAIHTSLADEILPDGSTIAQDASAITAADRAALDGSPTAGSASSVSPLIYPYDGTVFPLGLVAPVAEFSAGTVAPIDFKISLTTTGFHWDGLGHVGDPKAPLAAIPQNVWDGALASATLAGTNGNVTLALVTATGGVAHGPSTTHLIIAPGKLTGVIYFESYSSDPLPGMADGGTDFGLWSVKPGLTKPPSHLEPGCVLCHSVSASGNTLTASTDDQDGPTTGSSTGVFRIEADGGITHLATAPTALPYTESSSRGLGWATVSPDGRVVMRSVTQYWGGDALLAWAVPSAPLLGDGGLQPLSSAVAVNGNLDMFVPEYSPDGRHLVYVTAPGGVEAGVPGTPSQSIGMLDITANLTEAGVDAAWSGAVSLTNPHTLYDSTKAGLPDGGGGNAYTKVPAFLPDSQSIVFEETVQASPWSDNMLPDYVNNAETAFVDGALAMLQPTGAGGYARVALTRANTGHDPSAAAHNYEPKPLPVQVGGYYWVVFASTRADAYPGIQNPKKLWVTAISPSPKTCIDSCTTGGAAKDTSHPAFTLVNQAIVAGQKSQRAYWSLAPCQPKGASCQNTNDCCAGSCLPEGGGSHALVCGTPPTAQCVPVGGRCDVNKPAECCGSTAGVECIGTLNGYGTCSVPAPPP